MRLIRTLPFLAPMLLLTACGGDPEQSSVASTGTTLLAAKPTVSAANQTAVATTPQATTDPVVTCTQPEFRAVEHYARSDDIGIRFRFACITTGFQLQTSTTYSQLSNGTVVTNTSSGTLYLQPQNLQGPLNDQTYEFGGYSSDGFLTYVTTVTMVMPDGSNITRSSDTPPPPPPPDPDDSQSKWKTQLDELLKTVTVAPALQPQVTRLLSEIQKYEARGQVQQADVLRKLLVVHLQKYQSAPNSTPPVLTIPDGFFDEIERNGRPMPRPGNSVGTGVRG